MQPGDDVIVEMAGFCGAAKNLMDGKAEKFIVMIVSSTPRNWSETVLNPLLYI